MALTDIQSREDITLLIERFYDKVRQDELLGYIFNEVAQVNWEVHLPIIIDFWQSILIGPSVYRGNAMEPHLHLNTKVPLEHQHFERWLALFTTTVEQYFSGPVATEACNRARNIAGLMQVMLKRNATGS